MNNKMPQTNYSKTGFQSIHKKDVLEMIRYELGISNAISLKIQRITTGNVNRSFYVLINHKIEYVVKICPLWFTGSLLRDKLLNEYLKKQGLNTPEIIFYKERKEGKNIPFEFHCTKYIEGKLLSKESSWIKHLNKILIFYTTAHKKSGTRYGWCNSPWSGLYNSWQSFIKEKFIRQDNPVIRSIDKSVLVNLLNSLDNMKIPPRVLIGDFNTNNFIVTEKEIFGFDFQNTMLGDPIYDYAQIIAKEPKYINEIIKQLKILKIPMGLAEEKILLFYAICIASETLYYHKKKYNIIMARQTNRQINILIKKLHAQFIV